MQPHGWTALPATAPALTQTAALVEEQQVPFILLRSSPWEEEEQSSGSPEGITPTLPTAHLGSAGPSCLWQQHCGGITASSCVTVPCLCWDTAAVVQVCCKPFNGQQAATDTEPQDSPGVCSSGAAHIAVVFPIPHAVSVGRSRGAAIPSPQL